MTATLRNRLSPSRSAMGDGRCHNLQEIARTILSACWNCIIKERGTYADLSATGAKARTGCRAESPSLPNPVFSAMQWMGFVGFMLTDELRWMKGWTRLLLRQGRRLCPTTHSLSSDGSFLVYRFGSSPTKGRRIASASGSSHRQLHDGGYPPFLPFQPVFGTNTG